MQKVLADKEKEITEAKDRLCQAKKEAIREYRDSDALLVELRGSFAEGFDDCLCQVEASYPDLNLSNINIDAPAQTSVQFVASKSTNELFAEDVLGDGETAQTFPFKVFCILIRQWYLFCLMACFVVFMQWAYLVWPFYVAGVI